MHSVPAVLGDAAALTTHLVLTGETSRSVSHLVLFCAAP